VKIVCPYAEVHPATSRALRRASAEFHDVSGDDYAYWRLLRDLWAAGEAFIVVEHDIEPSAVQLRELAACPRPLCTFEYLYRGSAAVSALGCTKFGQQLLRRQLQWTFQLGALDFAGHPKWRDAQAYLLSQLPPAHVHEGLVRHHGALP